MYRDPLAGPIVYELSMCDFDLVMCITGYFTFGGVEGHLPRLFPFN